MVSKVEEILNSYKEFMVINAVEEKRLNEIVAQRKVYEKMLQENAFDYERYLQDYNALVGNLNLVLAEKLKNMPQNIYLKHINSEVNKGLAKLVVEFLGKQYDIYSDAIIDTSSRNGETKKLDVYVDEICEAAELLGVWINYSSDLEELKKIVKEYIKNPEEIKRIFVEKFLSEQRQKIYDKINALNAKETEIKEDLKIVEQILFNSIPLKENLLNKILYRDQIKIQQKQRKLFDQLEQLALNRDAHHRMLTDVILQQDCEYVFEEDIEAAQKLFSLLDMLEKRQADLEAYNKTNMQPILHKRSKINEKIKRNETIETMYTVRIDERKFEFIAYLQEMFKEDEELAFAIMNLNKEELTEEQYQALKTLKKFINKNKSMVVGA